MYYFTKTNNSEYSNAIDQVSEALSGEGFGILSKIDISATQDKAIDPAVRPEIIIVTFNPSVVLRSVYSRDFIDLTKNNRAKQKIGLENIKSKKTKKFIDDTLTSNSGVIETINHEISEKMNRVVDTLVNPPEN
jgi:hypothetical protein